MSSQALTLVTRHKDWTLPAPPFQSRSTANPLHVALLEKAQDYHCCLLAGLGFNYKCIAAQTGLSGGQIGYRLKKAGISVRAYRDGKSVLATLVIGNSARNAATALNRALVDFAPTRK